MKVLSSKLVLVVVPHPSAICNIMTTTNTYPEKDHAGYIAAKVRLMDEFFDGVDIPEMRSAMLGVFAYHLNPDPSTPEHIDPSEEMSEEEKQGFFFWMMFLDICEPVWDTKIKYGRNLSDEVQQQQFVSKANCYDYFVAKVQPWKFRSNMLSRYMIITRGKTTASLTPNESQFVEDWFFIMRLVDGMDRLEKTKEEYGLRKAV